MLFVSIASESQRQALVDLTQHATGRVAQRAWIVLWSDEHVPVPDIAQRLRLAPKTVRKWLRRYQRYGSSGLSDRPRSGRPTRLTPQAEQAIFMQLNQPPWTFGYVFAIWTVATLAQHLLTRCHQQVTPWLVRTVLHRLRYRFRRPKLGPRRVDPQREAVHQFIGKTSAEAAPSQHIVPLCDGFRGSSGDLVTGDC